MFKTAMIAACAIAMSATAANATTFYLKDVKFDDGTTLSGSFSTGYYGYVETHNMTSTNGALDGHHYVNDINVDHNPGTGDITVYHPDYQGFLTLSIGQALDTLNGDAAIITDGVSYECSDFSCPGGTARNITSGFITTLAPGGVPEPASWALMLGGTGLVGGALRHRRRSKLAIVTA
jgi:hypothetical protein